MTSRRSLFRFAAIFLAALLLPGSLATHAQNPPSASPQPPATILLIRHAEKADDSGSNLSPTGFERARQLPKLFLPPGARHDLPTPQFLFAAKATAHSNRPVETITPLAAALHLPINDAFNNEDYANLAAALLSGKYAGKVILIAWHHGKTPQLAAAHCASPPYSPWPEQQYDRIWRIDYVNHKATLTDLPFALMPGDSK
jgi:hypothetical protein